MDSVPNGMRMTPHHLWVQRNGEQAFIGMTDEGQLLLGHALYADLPEPGDELRRGEAFACIETIHEEKELLAPLSGRVTAVNPKLADQPHLINLSPLGQGWMIAVQVADPAELEELWSAERYQQWCEASSFIVP